MKKFLAIVIVLAIVLVALTACAAPATPPAEPDEPAPPAEEKPTEPEEPPEEPEPEAKEMTIYALTPTEDHGWTGSIGTFAKMEIEKINAEGKYKGVLLTANGPEEQINQIEDLLANNDPDSYAVSMLPYDDTVEAAVTQLIDAGVPVVMVDRIIMSQADRATANVKGDNIGTGAAAAWYCVQNGLTPDQRAYIVEGDSSSVNVARTDGFVGYLKGEIDYNGKIETPWTQEQIDANLVYSGVTGWSQAEAQSMFENLLADSANADIKYVVSWDSGTALGVIDALAGTSIDEATKEAFLANKPFICGCSGHPTIYGLLAGTEEDAAYKEIYEQLGGLMYTTYEPEMMADGVALMVDYLDGNPYEQDYVIPTEVVTKDNYANFTPFF